MAESKRTKKSTYQRVLRFPQAKGKTISEVQLAVSPDYLTIDLRFQDKTVLTFDLEPCVQVFPELIDWKSGNYRSLRQWKSIHSRPSRV